MIPLRPQFVPTVKGLSGTHRTTELTLEVMIKSSVYVRKKFISMNKETQSRNIFKSNTVLSMFAKNEGYYAIFPAD